MLTTNSKVNTPLGQGIVQGPFAVQSADGETIVRGALVRLPINETTRPHLNQSNCLTPRATLNGLWVFREGQLS